MPKFRNMPPMSCLKAFEAAARILSFKEAANELCVTPSAISHQIKSLEAFLGTELFIRNGNSINLSEKGRQYAFVTRQAFEMLNSASKEIMLSTDSNQLKVITSEFFKDKILDPILNDFKKHHPTIEIEIDTISDEVTLQSDMDFQDCLFDVALIWGVGEWPGADTWGVLETRISAFASPKMKGIEELNGDISTINKAPWIVNKQFPSAWMWWLSALGLSNFSASQKLLEAESFYESYNMAVAGEGLVLADKTLAANDVNSGKLVNISVKDIGSFAYYLCSPLDISNKRSVKLFREWLLNQATIHKWPPLRGMLRQNTKGNVYSLK